MQLQKLNTLKHGPWNLILFATRYHQNDRIAIVAQTSEGEPYATISVNIPHANLEEDEFCVQDWNQPDKFLNALLRLDTFEKVEGKTAGSGFVTAPVWRITDTSLLIPKKS
jgi:hypothetical protein